MLACINSRPLGVVDPDTPAEQSGFRSITPHELVYGYSLSILPKFKHEEDVYTKHQISTKKKLIAHQKHLQQLLSQKWSCFLLNYIDLLNEYHKKNTCSNLKEGDILLYNCKADPSPPGTYVLARVQKIQFGRDPNVIRSIVVRLKKSKQFETITRPISHFSKLELGE